MAKNSLHIRRFRPPHGPARSYLITREGSGYRLWAYWYGGRHATYKLTTCHSNVSVPMVTNPFQWDGDAVTSFRTLAKVTAFAEWWFDRVTAIP